MLEPDHRHSLLDALRPPPGFSLDRAVGTTFSLDLHALLTAPVAFALFDADASSDDTLDATAVLEATRRNADRIDIFCQAGHIAVPTAYRPLVAFVESMVHEVQAPTATRVFHPKVWLIRFRSSAGESAFRLLCLSRNLTFDRSWDTVLRLEGATMKPSAALRNQNAPLARFIRSLPQLALSPVADDRADSIAALAGELDSVDFGLPPGFTALRFWPLGLDGSRPWPFDRDGWAHNRLLVVAPFLSAPFLGRLRSTGSADVIVSRRESLDALAQDHLARYAQAKVMAPAALGDVGEQLPLGADDETLAERPEAQLQGLHAKLFVSQSGRKARLWTGSANATSAAFAGNVEFLVELEGPASLCGVDAVLEGDGAGIRMLDLLETYEHSESSSEDDAVLALERRLDELRRAIAGTGFMAVASPDEDDETYQLRLSSRAALPDMKDAGCRMWPITLGVDRARSMVRHDGVWVFERVSVVALTPFFAVELEAAAGDARASVRFVVMAELEGAPANRHDRLLTTILRDRASVMRYILLLLAGDEGAAAAGSDLLGDHGDGTWGDGGPTLPVLETLVRTLARDPSRLDHVARLISSLQGSEDGRALLPDGLEEIWEPLWAAREALR